MKKKEERICVHNKFDGHCAYCGEKITVKQMQVDHIVPQYDFIWHIKNKIRVPDFLSHLTEADCDHIDNKFPTCRICNKWKATFDLETFRWELMSQPDRARARSANYRMSLRYRQIKETRHPVVFYFELTPK